jgi:hypothetical protein
MTNAAGVVTAKKSDPAFAREFVEAMGWHRHRNRGPS